MSDHQLSLLSMSPSQLTRETELALAVLATADNSVLVSVITDLVSAELVRITDEYTPGLAMQAAVYRVAAGLVVTKQKEMERMG